MQWHLLPEAGTPSSLVQSLNSFERIHGRAYELDSGAFVLAAATHLALVIMLRDVLRWVAC